MDYFLPSIQHELLSCFAYILGLGATKPRAHLPSDFFTFDID